ncbi:hypothetical protein [Agromyces sp. LHK192]|uniref:hypothetical protein n=1 Tax=Agromyces sp. LHK192 TaxID=2498704 RepID=UPI000FDB72AC|nr:hypothetical protein [Agromyces sp. LHK192]
MPLRSTIAIGALAALALVGSAAVPAAATTVAAGAAAPGIAPSGIAVSGGDSSDRHGPPGRDPLRGAVNLPADGKVDFILGQDGGTLHDFHEQAIDDGAFPQPAGVSLFASINGITPLNGLWSPVDYRVGRTDFEEVLSEHPGKLTIGLELIDYSQDLASDGRNLGLRAIAGDPSVDPAVVAWYRGWVDELIRYADATKREVFLKVGYEFDGHWNNYEPEAYKAAFRHIAGRIDALRAKRVATVWQTAAWGAAIPDKAVVGADAYGAADAVLAGDAEAHWNRWYPGDDAVDWMGVSRFAAESATDPGRPWSCDRGPVGAPDTLMVPSQRVAESLLDFAREHRKPVIVAEAAPQGYDLGEHTVSCVFANGSPAPYAQRTPVTTDQVWAEWFAPTFDFVRANRDVVRSFTYINTDWDSQGNWACTGPGACNAGYWGDSRLQADPVILERVAAELRDRAVWTTSRERAREFTAPDFSQGRGVFEAEYAEASTWQDCCGLGGLPQVAAAASNGREVMLMNFGDGGSSAPELRFEDVGPGRAVTVELNSLRDGFEQSDATFSVLVDGVEIATPVVVPKLPAGEYATVTFDARLGARSDVTVRLNPNTGGNLIWVDRLTVGRR